MNDVYTQQIMERTCEGAAIACLCFCIAWVLSQKKRMCIYLSKQKNT